MSENRLPDYIDHIQQAAADACSFTEGMGKADFLADKRARTAVVMTLVIIDDAATQVLERYPRFAERRSEIPWRAMRIAQSHRSWLFRYQLHRCLGHGRERPAAIAFAVAGMPRGCGE